MDRQVAIKRSLAKVAVITGAARGIGRATAVAFAREGTDEAGIDISAPIYPASGVSSATAQGLEDAGSAVRAPGGRWLGIVADHRGRIVHSDDCAMTRCSWIPAVEASPENRTIRRGRSPAFGSRALRSIAPNLGRILCR